MFQEAKHFVKHLWWALLAYTLAFKYVVWELYQRKFSKLKKLELENFPRQDGRVAVVTGGSKGIGLEIVYNLIECGYSVIIGSSSSEVTRMNLQQSIQKKYPDCSVEVWHLDLASLKSVKSFIEKYLSTRRPLHLLINNAGIMFVTRETTEDGYEKHFAVNYLSHCLLTMLLLPLLLKSGAKERHSRIVNCSSCIHFVGSKDVINFDTWRYYSKYKAYIQSKLAQILFTYSLQAKLQVEKLNVDVNCVHPGIVNTELMTKVLLFPKAGSLFFKTAKDGADTATYLALSTEMEGIGGKYLEDSIILPSSKISNDIHIQQELWKKTMKVLEPWLYEEQIVM